MVTYTNQKRSYNRYAMYVHNTRHCIVKKPSSAIMAVSLIHWSLSGVMNVPTLRPLMMSRMVSLGLMPLAMVTAQPPSLARTAAFILLSIPPFPMYIHERYHLCTSPYMRNQGLCVYIQGQLHCFVIDLPLCQTIHKIDLTFMVTLIVYQT